MPADAQTMPEQDAKPPKRLLRNYLLNPAFQLKYTGAVVLVTALVAGGTGGWLGYEAYRYSTGMSDMLLMQQSTAAMFDEEAIAMGNADEMQELFERESRERDAEVRNQIIAGVTGLVLVLVVALGITGIIVTHKVVGPAYKLKLQLGDIANGNLNIQGGFRKGDELQDVGEAFKAMVAALRRRQQEEIADLDDIIESAKEADVAEGIVDKIADLRARMQAELEA